MRLPIQFLLTASLAIGCVGRPFMPIKGVPLSSLCGTINDDPNCRPGEGRWVPAKNVPPYEVSNADLSELDDTVYDRRIREELATHFLFAAWPEAGADRCIDLRSSNDRSELLMHMESLGPSRTSVDEVVVSASLLEVDSDLAAQLTTSKVSREVALSVSTDFRTHLLKKLRESNIINAPQARYFQVRVDRRIGKGSGAQRQMRGLAQCAGKSIAVGITVFEVRDLVLNTDTDIESVFQTALDLAIQGKADVNAALTAGFKAGLAIKFVKQLKSHITLKTDYRGKTVFYPAWIKYDTVDGDPVASTEENREARKKAVVVLMDSPLLVYDETSRAAGRTNGDDISDVLKDLPMQIFKENTSEAWYRDQQVLDMNPDLIIIHLSGFYRKTNPDDGDKKFRTFVDQVLKHSHAKMLVYSRELAADDEHETRERWEKQIGFLTNPEWTQRVSLLRIAAEHASFRDPITARALKSRVEDILASDVRPRSVPSTVASAPGPTPSATASEPRPARPIPCDLSCDGSALQLGSASTYQITLTEKDTSGKDQMSVHWQDPKLWDLMSAAVGATTTVQGPGRLFICSRTPNTGGGCDAGCIVHPPSAASFTVDRARVAVSVSCR